MDRTPPRKVFRDELGRFSRDPESEAMERFAGVLELFLAGLVVAEMVRHPEVAATVTGWSEEALKGLRRAIFGNDDADIAVSHVPPHRPDPENGVIEARPWAHDPARGPQTPPGAEHPPLGPGHTIPPLGDLLGRQARRAR